MSSTSVILANRTKEISRLSQFLEQFGADHHLSTDEILDINLVLDEVVINVIKYAYEDDREHPIEVRLSRDGDLVTIQVEDGGRPFNPLDQPPPNFDLPIEERGVGGLGIHIVRSMTESIDYQRMGDRNVVTMTKRVGSG